MKKLILIPSLSMALVMQACVAYVNDRGDHHEHHDDHDDHDHH